MTTLEIVLIIIGLVMMVASFFVTEKLSNQDLDKVAELSTEEMQRILERSLTDAQVKVDNMVDQVIDHSIEKSMEVVERALDKETNEKMRAITEYSDTVLESIHKTHNEVMFLYSMLNVKHSVLTKYSGNLPTIYFDRIARLRNWNRILRIRWNSRKRFWILSKSLLLYLQQPQRRLT